MHPFIIQSSILHPVDVNTLQWIADGSIVISEEGKILFVDHSHLLPEKYSHLTKHTLQDHIISPGFIDLHTHLPQLYCRGKVGASLFDWLEKYIYPEEAKFNDAIIAQTTAQLFFKELIRSGTTTACVFSSNFITATNLAFQEAERSHLRIMMGKTQMDRNVPAELCEDKNQSLHETEQLIKQWHRKNDRLWYAVTPRFAASCSMELMKQSASLAEKYDTYIQTHINESNQEIERVRSLFPKHRNYAHVYEDAGLLSSKTILAHNIHVMEDEFKLLEQHCAAVAHCPDSNLFLGSGQFPLSRYEQSSIRFGLGSDVGAGTSLSMFRMMRSMAHVQEKSIHPSKLLYYATLGGARALSLDHVIGNFKVGKYFDAIAVKKEAFLNFDHFDKMSADEVASTFVYCGESSHIEKVFVQGIEINNSL